MSEPLRLELSGKNAEQWHRLFSDLSGIIISGVMNIIPEENEEQRKQTNEFINSIAEITKGWVRAKVERPSLENEEIIARTINLFEEAKLKRAQCERQEIENQSARLDLMFKRVEMALRMLRMLNNHFSMDGDKLVLILTNENLGVLQADMKALAHQSSEEAV